MTTENKPEENEGGLYNVARKVLLAAVGVTVVAQEEMEKLVDKLAEKGEIAERDARRLMKEVGEKRDEMLKARKDEAEKNRPSTATKADLDALNARVEELTRKIEEMKKKAS